MGSVVFVISNRKSAGSHGTKAIKRTSLGGCNKVSALSKFELEEHSPLREEECLGGCHVPLGIDREPKPLTW